MNRVGSNGLLIAEWALDAASARPVTASRLVPTLSTIHRIATLVDTATVKTAFHAWVRAQVGTETVAINGKVRGAKRKPTEKRVFRIAAINVLAGGRKGVIFQLSDDHSRYAVASHVAWSENAVDAMFVFDKGVAAHGVPQRLLTDNGVALNPSRRGVVGQLVAHVRALGVEPITGKPYRPTTQGKNERFHQTLFRFLDKQPLAGTLAELQQQVDRFDVICNTERPHQALPGRVTPQQAWDATPKTQPPRPKPDAQQHALQLLGQPAPAPHERVDDEIRITRIGDNGTIYARGTKFQTSRALAGQLAHVISDDDTLTIFDARGTFIIEHAWPAPGTKYVGSGNPRGRPPRTLPASPMS